MAKQVVRRPDSCVTDEGKPPRFKAWGIPISTSESGSTGTRSLQGSSLKREFGKNGPLPGLEGGEGVYLDG